MVGVLQLNDGVQIGDGAQITTCAVQLTQASLVNASGLTLLGSARGGSGPSFPAGVAANLGNVNQVANPMMFGALVGAIGTTGRLPDLWTSDFGDTAFGMAAPQLVGTGIEGGLPYVDVRFNGTPTAGAAGRMQIVFQHFVEGAAQARANAVNLKLAAGSLTNCAVNTFANCSDTSNTYLTTLGFAAKAITGAALNTQKWPFTYTTVASTGYVDAAMSVSYSVGNPVDVTVRFGLPQDERGATTHDLLISTPVNDGFFSRAIPPAFFGSHVESPGAGGEPFPFTNGPYTVLSRGKSFNPECRWNDTTNPSAGVYNFAGLDAWYALLVSAGMVPVFTTFTGDQKPTYVGGTATNPTVAQWQTWVTALINRYPLAIWEGINEVDGGVFWTGTKATAVTMQQFLYATVKAKYPSAIVLGPSITGAVTGIGYMRDLLALGIGDYCDVFNYHSYNQGASYTPELNLAVNMAHLTMYRRFYGGTAKPLWDTEGSFAHPPAISNANKIDFLIKQGLLALSGGSEHSIWYATDNATYGTLWDATNGYNDTATALKILRAWTTGATPVGPASIVVNANNVQWSMDFTRAGGYTARIIWDTAGETYTVPAGFTQYRDCYGNRVPVNTGDALNQTDLPIMLESGNALGTFISGYVITPAQSNKTIWDTARDGALPGGSYTQVPMSNGSRIPTYYFSAAGSDANDGRTIFTPKQTITAANALTLTGSDYIAFRQGDTFAGALVIGQSGNALSSIIIGSYGLGAAPVIAPAASSSAIAATNQSYITVQGLTCTGVDTTSAAGAAGINFQTNTGTSTNIVVQNCTVSGFGDNGILFNVSATGHTSGCQVLGCTSFGNTIGTNSFTAGIQFTGNGNTATTYWPHANGLIDSCIAHDNPGHNGTANWCGSGIKIGSCNHTYVTNSVAYNNGLLCNLPSGGASGMWMSQANDSWIKFCESYNNSSVNADGCGFDIDNGCQNCGCMFDYSHDNTGAGFMDFSFSGQNGANLNNTIAFNLSVNDGTTNESGIRIIGSTASLTGNMTYNNTVFRKSGVGGNSACIEVQKSTGPLSATIANNIFVSENASCRLITTNATNPGAGVVFAGNCYYALSTFAIEWNGSSYSTGPLWQTATGQEKIAGSNVAFFAVEPLTYLLGAKGIIGDPSMGRLTVASPLYNTGVNTFTNFSIDPSIQGARDLYGGAVSSAGPYSVGCSWAGSSLTTILFSTPGDFTQTIAADFASLFSVETIGAGAGNTANGAGTGGGAYAKIFSTSTSLVAGVTQINGHVGASAIAANGEASWWNATSLANAQGLGAAVCCAADFGRTNVTTTLGAGGLAANSVGTIKFNGGDGGTTGTGANGGGGGAGGPHGAGAKGGNGGGTAGFGGGGGGGADGGSTPATPGTSTGGNGGNGPYGIGGGTGVATQTPGAAGSREGGGAGSTGTGGAQPGGNGGSGIAWGASKGPGAGSGAGVGVGTPAITGGPFGGGAAGRNGGPGGQGGVRFAYKTAGVV